MLKIIWNTVKTYLTVRKSVPMKLFWGVLFTASCSVYTHTCSAAVIYWKLHKHASCLVGFQRDSHTTKVAKEFWSHCLGHFYCEWWRFTMLSIITICQFVTNPNGCGNMLRSGGISAIYLGFSSMVQIPPQKTKQKQILAHCHASRLHQTVKQLVVNKYDFCGTHRPQITKHGSNYAVMCTLKVN